MLIFDKVLSVWRRVPDQVKRLSIPVAAIIVGFLVFRHFFVPSDFGQTGHYRASAVTEIGSQIPKYAGREACRECHDDVAVKKQASYHRDLGCEVCHGPAGEHLKDPQAHPLQGPKERGYCPLCHEYLPSRPTGFPQIISESHNPMKPCSSCHNAHDPKPPSVPKECEACHAAIARTKALSQHVYLTCTRCHETPANHSVVPREFRPKKPTSRGLCGSCHGKNSGAPADITKVDLETHGGAYVCWQCHYPHLPESR